MFTQIAAEDRLMGIIIAIFLRGLGAGKTAVNGYVGLERDALRTEVRWSRFHS